MFNSLGLAHKIFMDSAYETMLRRDRISRLGRLVSALQMMGWTLFLGVYMVVASLFCVVGTAFIPTTKHKELTS